MSDLSEIKQILDQQGRAFEEFKRTNDELIKAKADGKAIGDLEAKLAKIEKEGMSAGEAASAKLQAAEHEAKQAKAAAEEAKQALEELEAKLNRQGLGGLKGGTKTDVNAWARAVVDAHVKGVVNLSESQRKALEAVEAEYKSLSVSNDTTGGYLAPSEYVKEIIKGATEISPVRQLARVRATGAKSIILPKRTGQFAAVWVAEQGDRSETTGLKWGQLEIPAHEMYALIDISKQNLEDSAFDLEGEITFEATEQFAVAEGAAFVSGTGVGKPEGFLVNADVGITVTGAAAALTADSLFDVKHAIKTVYTRNANWALNRTTLGSVRKMKDGNGNYLWQSGLALGKPNTIDGDPYVEVPDMPNEAANAKPVAYGDFMRGYTLVDRIAMSMLRDPFTQATSGNIRFLLSRRVGGMVVLPEAIRVLKCSVS
ncbi:phage major capsid protein [Massilia sp. TS11]|uniref:phage major capsid protein n=1 Tax=Massilia sp. TS11 TaxID=2908003 RepID=UPI001EDAA54C|nr:phage major capsid protein [Massilia sp. TS11]MCG2586500.1 phage major capsid protein [Massilia sp. TS11]